MTAPPTPNPYDVLNAAPVRDSVATLKRMRQAKIFAAVRRRMASGEDMTLRSVGAECGLSHQTIANLGGAGSALVEAAIADYVRAITAQARHLPAPNRVLAWIDAVWMGFEQYQDYIVASTRAYYSDNGNVIKSLQRGGARLMYVELRQLKAVGKLRADFDVEAAASCVATLIPALTYAWMNGAFGFEDLHLRTRLGVSNMLSAGASPDHAAEIRHWLNARDAPSAKA